jgi:hypothetical protein
MYDKDKEKKETVEEKDMLVEQFQNVTLTLKSTIQETLKDVT